MIICKNVTKQYGDVMVLQQFHAQIEQGSVVCIMARSGAGKTTLAKMFMGLIAPDAGEITGTQGKVFSCAFQENRLAMQLDANANVRLACGNVATQTLADAFATLGFTTQEHAKPVGQLSGGQQRRVALCRAMLAQSDIVILDEPFQGLDDAVREKAIQFVLQTRANRTLICITHDEADALALGANVMNL